MKELYRPCSGKDEEANEILKLGRDAGQDKGELRRKIICIQENERKRIAREIHDMLGQQVTALRLKLQALSASVRSDHPSLQKRLSDLQSLLEDLDAQVDYVARELRPPELRDLGFVPAVEHFIRDWSSHFAIPVELEAVGLDEDDLRPEVSTNLYRIIQEALNNVAKHSNASEASLLMRKKEGIVTLTIGDSGSGIDLERKEPDGETHLGILGMRERAELLGGKLELESKPGGGTTLRVSVLAESAESAAS